MPRPLQGLIDLARRDPGEALRRARAERHPGNRCQYLAWVAHFSDERSVAAVAREALAACDELDNLYGSVLIAAWPLRALAERGLGGECERELPRVFERARRLANPVCRMDGLERVLNGVFAVDRARRAVLAELLDACAAASSWKVPRCLAHTAAMLVDHADDRALVLAALPEGRHRRSALRALAAGGRRPGVFF